MPPPDKKPNGPPPAAESPGATGRRGGTSPKTGRRPGTSGAREQILAAARRQFSEGGFDRTTIRAIASEAQADPSLVSHYFGTKQALFREIVDLGFNPDDLIAQLFAGPAEQQGERLARFVVGMLNNPVYGAAFSALIRAATNDPDAARLMRERITRDSLTPVAQKLEMDQPEIRAAIAATQTLGLVMGYRILKLDALTRLSEDELVSLIGPTLQRYLTEPL